MQERAEGRRGRLPCTEALAGARVRAKAEQDVVGRDVPRDEVGQGAGDVLRSGVGAGRRRGRDGPRGWRVGPGEGRAQMVDLVGELTERAVGVAYPGAEGARPRGFLPRVLEELGRTRQLGGEVGEDGLLVVLAGGEGPQPQLVQVAGQRTVITGRPV